jgi:DNA-binding NtrC family response regulator
MPPLRDRKVDIPLLVDAFLKESAAENSKAFRELAPEAMTAVLDYDWPGNVRELRTAIEHGVVMSTADRIALRDLPASVRNRTHDATPASPGGLNLQETETALILRALEDCRGNRTDAARMLGISRRTLHRRLKELNISKRSNLS